uniref:Kinesin motor domain-containing protein n=1 Tax=Macrostomum lignano TaxID=282301 RepID=A0A1I8F6U1_9PLAT
SGPSPLKKLGAAGRLSRAPDCRWRASFSRVSRLEAEHESGCAHLQRVAPGGERLDRRQSKEGVDSEKASHPSGGRSAATKLRPAAAGQADSGAAGTRPESPQLAAGSSNTRQAAADTTETGTSLTKRRRECPRSRIEKATSLSKQLKAPPPLLDALADAVHSAGGSGSEERAPAVAPVAKDQRSAAVSWNTRARSSGRQEPQLMSVEVRSPGIQQGSAGSLKLQAALSSPWSWPNYVRRRQPAMRLREPPTLVQPRNPVNSPELLAP